MFALIVRKSVWELFDEDPKLAPGLQVIDVSAVPDVAPGWVLNDDGSFSLPPSPLDLPGATIEA